ncbi:STAS domain-containing protein [Falsihalocynthiibacter sp. SS001]|uniref:STAS domain-containing protein n=1 Tax=Falsihalocynthiibacter sp. SS001 TaxID=3349698 RepID=UPI0036D3214D
MTARVQLQGRLGLPEAEPLAQRLRAARGDDVAVDAAQVTHLGVLCQQVLLSAAAEWHAAGRSFKIVNPSDDCVDHLALCGLSPASFEESNE